ncbi:sugar phosphate isomerase/epimerase family protein [Paenibacillus sacheonensis]|uniref:TIM barrel protein n=1 Tax=Paenibacillus sacheonensis TaxID=742054 RepID=A0A7X4YQ59_9BACL|nr:sugar phosphate isomerase/epimerase [Paenibacillus sacheonensis]MBM7565530.1 sugar phosphate isomerase/epimerase [Paenibacillus sacheonensis]NBC69549.1 TIM barrel protein [Paenibacillus sacheonensis]
MTIACSTSIRSGSSLEAALAEVGGLGFSRVDLLAIDGWAHINPSDLARDYEGERDRLTSLLAQYKLQPLALNTGTGPQLHDRSEPSNRRRIEEIQAIIRLMNDYEITLAAIQPRNNDPGRPWSDVLADCVATLREYDALGRAAGITFALELHVNSPFETLEQAKRLVDAMPQIRLVYDPTHFVMQGIDIRETEWLMDYASHVHLRDASLGRMQTAFGAGGVDFDWVLGTLAARGYAGHFSIEYLEEGGVDWTADILALRDRISRYFPE